MDCKFNIQDMVPFVALEKLKSTIDISSATPEEMLKKFSELVWDFETAYHNVKEHEGFKWTNDTED
ncbi:hypothetical protein [Vallitalea guaymasensis]|uniref:hypothetical protein n=1 Tax=Vallitalea guaymasensis TaxID=1185412 RepID=UPI000DE34FE4|nr:hypothetical protein [Vallitalea guaymasensis]